jgi:hypothetical protein
MKGNVAAGCDLSLSQISQLQLMEGMQYFGALFLLHYGMTSEQVLSHAAGKIK